MRRNIFQKTAVVFWVFGGGVLVERLYAAYGHHTGGKETPVLMLLSLTSLVVGSMFQYIGSSTTRTGDR